jgi:hypothetical protein
VGGIHRRAAVATKGWKKSEKKDPINRDGTLDVDAGSLRDSALLGWISEQERNERKGKVTRA